MRVVADTNTVISGLLWRGNPRRVLDAARSGAIQLFTSLPLLAEIDEVLARPKFAHRLALAAVSSHELVVGYAALAFIVQPAEIKPTIVDDPDDDEVLACAQSAHGDAIVSGDSHLLLLEKHGDIPILTARQLLTKLDV